jgi:hypothetical protein
VAIPKPKKTPPKPVPLENILTSRSPGALERAALVHKQMLAEGRDPLAHMTRKPPVPETEA